MEYSKSTLLVRTEIFDHGIFPLPPRITLTNLVSLFKDLSQFSPNHQIKLEQFKLKLEMHSIHLNPLDVDIIFIFYKLLSENDLSSLNLFPFSNKSNLSCDIRGLSLFFFIQLFGNHSTRFSLEKKPKEFSSSWNSSSPMNLQFNEGRANSNSLSGFSNSNSNPNFSPLNSPRSKTMRLFNYSNESQNIINFLKFNMKSLIKTICNENSNNEDDIIVTEEIVNILEVFLKNENNYKSSQISNISGLNKIIGGKGNLNIVSDWITNNMAIQESNFRTVIIQGLTKSVTLREPSTCDNKDFKISCCEDSYIYIDGCLENLHINNCVNCTIFISAVKKITTIDKCENINLTIVSNILRIGNTIDSKIFYYGSIGPILFGDNRSINLAPNNTNYIEFLDRLKKAEILIHSKNLNNFKNPIIMNKDNNINYHICDAKDFHHCILPNNFKTFHFTLIKDIDSLWNIVNSNKFNELKENLDKKKNDNSIIVPLLAPPEYKEEILIKNKKINDFQNLIKNSNLNEEQAKNLHSIIQGYFKEWLMNTNSIKPISDLIKLIDQE